MNVWNHSSVIIEDGPGEPAPLTPTVVAEICFVVHVNVEAHSTLPTRRNVPAVSAVVRQVLPL